MVPVSMRLLLFAVFVLGLGCATTGATPAPGPSPVIATYGDRVIRQAEVDARAADELLKLQEEMYELRVKTAERIAVEMLVAEAAKKEGKSDEQWLNEKLEQDVAPPSEAEMRKLFEQVKARLPEGVGFEDVKPQLAQAVGREAKSKRAHEIFERLKHEARFRVELEAPPRPRKMVEAIGPSKGSDQAPVTIVEFADFECPYCARAAATMERVLAAYEGKVRLVFRHFPLSFHRKASKAAEAGACADEQGKFWALHDALFESRDLEPEALKQQAQRLGLNSAKFDSCLDSGRTADLVKRDMAAGQRAGVTGTPAFFINGRLLSGAQPEDEFRKVIDQELAAVKN
jgi:predicted DsbA family dithiol-disulfide isomerase